MKHTRYMTASALAIAAATAFVGGAQASTLNITSVSGIWQNDVPDSGVTGEGTNRLTWGVGTPQSAYQFDGAAPPAFTVAEGTLFDLGTFTHENFPVFPPSLESADLQVTITVQGFGDITSVFSFTHNETTNTAPCEFDSVTPCADLVEVALNLGKTETFSIDGVDYIFTVNGFEHDGATETSLSFVTQESDTNTASLKGSFITAPPAVIPLPAAGWLLLAGIGGLGALRRFRKA